MLSLIFQLISVSSVSQKYYSLQSIYNAFDLIVVVVKQKTIKQKSECFRCFINIRLNSTLICIVLKLLEMCDKQTKRFKKWYYEKKVKTVMINNSTNISKQNNHFPPSLTDNTRLRNMASGIHVLVCTGTDIWRG